MKANLKIDNFYTLRRRDPTGTLGLRRSFAADATRRHKALKRAIWQSVAINDVFALRERTVQTVLLMLQADTFGVNPLGPRAFEFERSDQKISHFMDWLQGEESKSTMQVIVDPTLPRGQEAWSDKYILSAYQQGIADSRRDLIAEGVDIPSFDPTDVRLAAVFNQPIHADRAGLIFTRTFNALKGVDDEMDKQISRILAKGLAEGRNPNQLAREMNNRIDKIGITRSRLLARTEIVQTHNEATLNEYEAQSVILGEEILAEWSTARDERVRSIHIDRHGNVYERDEALKLLGEPNCRCGLIPYIESIHGERILKVRPDENLMGSAGELATCVVTGDKRPPAFVTSKKPSACNDFVRVGEKWYLHGKEVTGDELKNLNAMKLPPGWQQVTAATDPTARVQAIGLDAAGRWQYRYSAEHVQAAAMKKFNRVKLFSKDMKKVRKGIKKGIKAGDSQAFLLELENKTAIRAGSIADFKAKQKAYGLTTLQYEHVQVRGSNIILDFVAKEGIPVRYELEDIVLAQWLEQRKAAASIGDMLFPDISANKLNKYLKDLAGGKSYTIKDFRTYHGTRIAYEELQQYAGQDVSVIQKKKIIKRISERVGGFLKNTPGMAKKSYIDPMVWDLIGGV